MSIIWLYKKANINQIGLNKTKENTLRSKRNYSQSIPLRLDNILYVLSNSGTFEGNNYKDQQSCSNLFPPIINKDKQRSKIASIANSKLNRKEPQNHACHNKKGKNEIQIILGEPSKIFVSILPFPSHARIS